MNFTQKKTLQEILIISFLILLSVLYLLIYSTSTTPLLGLPMEGDSAIFQTIGKYWLQGKIPYVDLWDSKGPIIFFINAVGYYLTGSSLGIFFIQIVNLTVTCYFILKIYRQEFDSKVSTLLLIIALVVLTFVYEGGNLTEEYALPLLTASFYCFIKWSNQVAAGITVHNPGWTFLYGVCFGFCLLTRVTNAVGLCVGIVVICAYLVINKQWKNILQNIVYFCVGLLLIIVPFVIYFWINGALYEMVYGTILYNIGYAGASTFQLSSFGISEIVCYLGCYSLYIISGISFFKDKERRIESILWILVAGITQLWLLRCFGYKHYSMINVPYFCIAMTKLHRLYKLAGGTWRKRCVQLTVLLMILIGFAGLAKETFDSIQMFKSYYSDEGEQSITAGDAMIAMVKRIPEEDRDSFVAYNCYTGLYLQTDICPCYRYFTLQSLASGRNESLLKRVLDKFSTGNAEWILVDERRYAEIQDILDERYECVEIQQIEKSMDTFKMYRLESGAESEISYE